MNKNQIIEKLQLIKPVLQEVQLVNKKGIKPKYFQAIQQDLIYV